MDYVVIAKMAARQTVSLVVARKTSQFVVDHTDTDPESITLKVGSFCVGEVTASYAKPYTDEAVERAAAWIESKRNKIKEAAKTE